jgi:hypothetical protein
MLRCETDLDECFGCALVGYDTSRGMAVPGMSKLPTRSLPGSGGLTRAAHWRAFSSRC